MSRHKVNKAVKKQKSRWPLAAALAGLLLITGAILLAGKDQDQGYTTELKGEPAIEVDQQEFDYGDVKLGSMVTTSVKVTNTGGEPLRFTGRPYVELIDGC